MAIGKGSQESVGEGCMQLCALRDLCVDGHACSDGGLTRF